MTLRFVHLGDLHLLSTHPRNEDRRLALEHVIAEQVDVSAWLWPGDLNHGRMTIDDRNFLAACLQTMANRAPVVLCYGNHDQPGDLDVFAKLKANWPVYVVSEPETLNVPLASRNVACVFCLPYPNKAGLVAAGLAHEELHHATQNAMDLIFMEAATQLDKARAAGRPALMIGHVNVAGSVSSVGQPQIGTELEITEAHLTRLGPVPKLLNHIHKHQSVGGADYAGSLCRLDWGEVEPKGYQVITLTHSLLTDGSVAASKLSTHGLQYSYEKWAHDVEFVPLTVPPMYHIEGDWTDAAIADAVVTKWADDRFAWTVRRGPGGDVITERPRDETGTTDWSGCDVRVRMRYAQAEQARLADRRRRVEHLFGGARRLEVEPVVIPDRALRAPQVVAAKTLDEKLRAWAEVSGVNWTGVLAGCGGSLATVDGEALFTAVQARLEPLADVVGLLKEEGLPV